MKQVDSAIPAKLPSEADSSNAISALREGLTQEVGDMVKLELTAEQMLQDEAQLVFDYIAHDARHFWSDLKSGFLDWEAATGEVLLSAADPTSLEWQLGQWWSHKPYLYHHIK